MSMATGAKLQLEPGSWMEAAYDVYIGSVVGASHFFKIVCKWWYVHLIRPVVNLFGFHLKRDKDVVSKDGKKTLKVVSVGYGRTGTYSLTLALEEMGMPTLHTQHLYEHEAILSMWADKVFVPSIKARKTLMGKPDLQLLVDTGFQATADLPMSLYFEQVMEEFPNCKFILTTRANSEEWFQSWDTLTKSITNPTHVGGVFFTGSRQYTQYLRWLFSVVNKEETYLTASFPLPDQNKEAAIASYEEHNRRVRELIPADKLLEYNVKDGWEPLCSFLEIQDCPQTPFPKTNSARSVQVQAISAFIVPFMFFLFILFTAFAFTFKFLTGMTVMTWANWKSRELMHTLRRVLLGQEKMDWVVTSSKMPMRRKKI